jgi:hypothetical protein
LGPPPPAATPELTRRLIEQSIQVANAAWVRVRASRRRIFAWPLVVAGGSAGESRRADKIAERLADGRLPRTKPMALWAGSGSGLACDGCGDVIVHREVEHERDLEGGACLRFHAACSLSWERMIAASAAGEAAAGDVENGG